MECPIHLIAPECDFYGIKPPLVTVAKKGRLATWTGLPCIFDVLLAANVAGLSPADYELATHEFLVMQLGDSPFGFVD